MKTAFFHMNQLGDFLFSLPLLAAARRQANEGELYSVIRLPLAPLLEATGLVGHIILRQKGGAGTSLALISRLRKEKFGRAVLFSESPEVLLQSFAAGIPERIGFSTASLGFLLTRAAARSGVPSLGNNRALAAQAGLSDLPADYVGLIRIPDHEIQKARSWCTAQQLDEKNLIIAAPGASRRRLEKCWDEARWQQLLGRLKSQGLAPVVIGAPSERQGLESLVSAVPGSIPVFTAQDGLLSLAALMRLARLFIGIDSGAMHLAAGVGTPVVALFGPTDPDQIGPQPLQAHRIIRRQTMREISSQEAEEGVLFSLK